MIHNDIKLENVVVGYDDANIVHLIDYGLASRYTLSNGEHISPMELGKF